MATLHPLLHRLRDLDFPVTDYAIFGSGPLLVRGWIDDAGDLDLIAREPVLTLARAVGEPLYLPAQDVTVTSIDDEAITIGSSWAWIDVDIDDLIDTAELIDGFPCVLLEHVVAYKQAA
ncbi:MAG: hypothetical protein HKN91_01525, partial [Acidimicrobiia bacterium]|nr:hypothetical protein [Acidimicrobiia bacterium]